LGEKRAQRLRVTLSRFKGEPSCGGSPLQELLSVASVRGGKFFLILSFFFLISCAAYPRYTTHPVSQPSSISESKIDKLKMTRIMESYLGEPHSNYDCSALVRQVYLRYSGINLPPDTKKLFLLVKKVEKEELSFGDLVFFTEDGLSPFHVGIYTGNNQFVHSSSSQGVTISSLDEKYYARRFLGGRRVIP
jgi:cell wall-associated NlpC family hydrolase